MEGWDAWPSPPEPQIPMSQERQQSPVMETREPPAGATGDEMPGHDPAATEVRPPSPQRWAPLAVKKWVPDVQPEVVMEEIPRIPTTAAGHPTDLGASSN